MGAGTSGSPEYVAEVKVLESLYPLHPTKQISLCPVCLLPLPVEILLSLHAAPHSFWNKKGKCLLFCPSSLVSLLPSPSFCRRTWRTLPYASYVWLTWQSVVCEFIATRLCFLEHWDHVFFMLVTVLCNSECSITAIQTDLKRKKWKGKNYFWKDLGL